MTHTLGVLDVDSQDRAFSKVITEKTIAQAEEAIQMEVSNGSENPAETEINNREDSEISWTKDTKTAPGVINWRALAAELTWENLWTKRDLKSIGNH